MLNYACEMLHYSDIEIEILSRILQQINNRSFKCYLKTICGDTLLPNLQSIWKGITHLLQKHREVVLIVKVN